MRQLLFACDGLLLSESSASVDGVQAQCDLCEHWLEDGGRPAGCIVGDGRSPWREEDRHQRPFTGDRSQ
eukprot:10266258-Lingulodinium_polyedra.AAC.1